MELTFSKNKISFKKELSQLDRFVIKFVKMLKKHKIDYVIISGYIAILFGRSRETEDVDFFIEEMGFGKFQGFWNGLMKEFDCLNAADTKDAYENYLKERLAIRFALKNTFMPNCEIKFPKTDLNHYSLLNKVIVTVDDFTLNTSQMELQIAYKLYLGSEKDMEDAIHLWQIFKDKIDLQLFIKFANRLGVYNRIKELD